MIYASVTITYFFFEATLEIVSGLLATTFAAPSLIQVSSERQAGEEEDEVKRGCRAVREEAEASERPMTQQRFTMFL